MNIAELWPKDNNTFNENIIMCIKVIDNDNKMEYNADKHYSPYSPDEFSEI